jgi:hypothetical protein
MEAEKRVEEESERRQKEGKRDGKGLDKSKEFSNLLE